MQTDLIQQLKSRQAYLEQLIAHRDKELTAVNALLEHMEAEPAAQERSLELSDGIAKHLGEGRAAPRREGGPGPRGVLVYDSTAKNLFEILANEQPLTEEALLEELAQVGVKFRGRNPKVTLRKLLKADGLFASVGPETWALKE